MIAYWCGFNGFNQISREKTIFISQFRKMPLSSIKDFSFIWSCAIVLSDGEIFASGICGSNSNILTKLTKPDNVSEFLKVACNETYALFTSEDGECWQYYYNTTEWKKLVNFAVVEKGHDILISNKKSLHATEKRPEQCEDKDINKIIKICCGEIVNIALDSSGQAYSIPSLISMPGIKIKEVTCGFEHCLLLDEFGRVYSLGSGMRGQLGCEVLETIDSPQEIEALSGLQVVQIAAGGWHSAAVTSSGVLYTWGWNNCGQLGFLCLDSSEASTYSECKEKSNKKSSSDHYSNTQNKNTKEHQEQFSEESEDVNIHKHKKIKCTPEETSLLNDNTKSLKTRNMSSEDTGECSIGATMEKKEFVSVIAYPKPVDFPSEVEIDIIDVSCGNRHTVALAGNGTVWGCGWNAYGQLGKSPETFDLVDSMILLDIPVDEKVCGVYCGGWNTALICNS